MFSRGFIAMLFLAALVCAKADEGKPLSETELAEFLGPNATSLMTWSAVGGPDFVVYYGTAKPPLSGGAGIYLGNAPNFEPDRASTVVRGKLGIFPVKWRRTVSPDGAIHQETLLSLDDLDIEKAHVWLNASNETDLTQLLGDLSRSPVFSHPYHSELHDEMYKMVAQDRRARIRGSLVSGTLFLAGAWFLDWRIRRRRGFALGRGLALGAYALGSGLLGAAMMLPNPLTGYLYSAVSLRATQQGLLTIFAFALLSLVFSLAVIAVSLAVRWRRGRHARAV
jgi:hypothetical protein